MSKPIVILGSARGDGNTRKLVERTFKNQEKDLIDLTMFRVNYYTYDYRHMDDDFLFLAEKMLNYEHIVFATPVYWYAMSAQLKTFFDRLTDLVSVKKEMGRMLKGKTMYLISCGSDGELPEGFEIPFQASATYLDMNFGGHLHGWMEQGKVAAEVQDKITSFVQPIQ